MCMIKIFWGRAGVVTAFKPPPSFEQLLLLPTPCFKMFLERSLNDPPTTPLQASFTATPSHPPPLPPLKILITHYFPLKHFIIDDINYQLNFSVYVATGGHCYATLIKTDIHLIAFDRLVYRISS